MPHTTAPTTPLFTTRQALDQELTATGTWKALHTAVHASTPRWTSYPHHNTSSEPVTGLKITEDVPHIGQARTGATILITPDGHCTIRAYTIPGHRWLTALEHLGTLHSHALRPGTPTTPDNPHWVLRPQVKDRSFSGCLHLSDHVQAKTLTELPDTIGDVSAMLTLIPGSPDAYPAAWLQAAGFFHVLATGAPARPQP
ncbi:hypothetical protein [Streptomyces flaveolus]|uniref:hypothetical protein n=1 Tax=Streptomyces flaveolus TaxID=67297 RepID=UPI003321855F